MYNPSSPQYLQLCPPIPQTKAGLGPPVIRYGDEMIQTAGTLSLTTDTAVETRAATGKRTRKEPAAGWTKAPRPARKKRASKKAVRKSSVESTDQPVVMDRRPCPQMNAADFEIPAEYRARQRAITSGGKELAVRFQPQTLDQCLVDPDTAAEMRDWLVRLGGRAKVDRSMPRGLMVVGHGGIGKSTMARLLLAEAGYKVTEYAADDVVDATGKHRYTVLSETGIEEIVQTLLMRNQAFGKQALLLDGVASDSVTKENAKRLASVISGATYAKRFNRPVDRVWQAPVVITCDVTELSGLSSVARVCHVVHLETPTRQQLMDRAQEICQVENFQLDQGTLRSVVEGSGGDVRRLMNTLNVLTLGASGTSVPSLDFLACDSLFYDPHCPFGLLREFIRRHQTGESSVEKLADFISVHPSSASMLVQENYPLMMTDPSIDRMAQCAELFSETEILSHCAFKLHHEDLCEAATISTNLDPISRFGLGAPEKLDKSAWYSWQAVTKNRRKLLATCSGLGIVSGSVGPGGKPGPSEMLDLCWGWSGKIQRHQTCKTVDAQWVEWVHSHGGSYRDLQDVWKCSQLPRAGGKTKTMPNPRGKRSLLKLLK